MEQENKKKSKIIIIFLIIIIVVLLGALFFEMFNNRNNKNTKTNNTNKTEEKKNTTGKNENNKEDESNKIEAKENYNGVLTYNEENGSLDKYVRDEKFNEVKNEIPTVEDILDDYLSIRHLTSLSDGALTKNYIVNPVKMSDADKIFYYAFGTAKEKNESGEYKLDSINKDLANSVFGDRIGNVKAASNSAFTYNSKTQVFTALDTGYPMGVGSFGNYIRIIDSNKKENNYTLKIKIGDVMSIDDDIYYIGGTKATYDQSNGSYKNTTKLDKNYKIENESLLDIVEIELKPYSNSYKYVISNISLK